LVGDDTKHRVVGHEEAVFGLIPAISNGHGECVKRKVCSRYRTFTD
jgi:hypothetical protein